MTRVVREQRAGKAVAVIHRDEPAQKSVDERLAALEAENTVLKARLTKVEKAQKNPA